MNLTDCMLTRRSGRKYMPQEIPGEVLRQILEAGMLAPSSRNLRPVEWIAVTEKDTLLQLSQAKTAGGAMLKNAGAAIVVAANSQLSDVWIEDCSISMAYMMLKATELGLANCWVQFRNRFSDQEGNDGKLPGGTVVKQILGIPEEYQVLAILSLGMADQLPEPHSLKELDWNKVHREKF